MILHEKKKRSDFTNTRRKKSQIWERQRKKKLHIYIKSGSSNIQKTRLLQNFLAKYVFVPV